MDPSEVPVDGGTAPAPTGAPARPAVVSADAAPRVIAHDTPPATDEARALLQHPKASTHIRSFALRAHRITDAQKHAWADLLPRYGLAYQPMVTDFSSAFGRQAPLVIEIGCGMGETTVRIAAADPQRDYVGIEVFTAGVGSLLKRIDEQQVGNLRVIQHDAVEVLRDMVARDSLDAIHVFFPDPWHKARHTKRRLIQPPLVSLLAARLRPGGTLHCATDWEPYAEQMLEVLGAEPLLINSVVNSVSNRPDKRADGGAHGYAPKPDYRPLTKFENRGLKLGHAVRDLVFHRR